MNPASRRGRAHRDERERAGELIATVLLWGGLASIALVIVGVALYAGHGGFRGAVIQLHRVEQASQPGNVPGAFSSIAAVLRGLTARPFDPLAVVALGLVLLLMTPVAGVAVAIPVFLAERDYRYATVATLVLAMLILSLFMSGGVA
jgi:uncharacterized membrane protein